MKIMKRPIDGIILLDKPKDLTSNAALQRVKRLLGAEKAGHTGSLDPLATGMLPICFGEATKFSQYLLNADKCYTVTGLLGVTTDTGDAEGNVLEQCDTVMVGADALQKAVHSFQGEIDQIPPMFSALKYQGKPLYHLARQGIEIERLPRAVNIYEISLLEFDGRFFELRVRCSKGTYIRSLVMDIGRYLGVGAHVTELHRVYTAGFEDMSMFTLEQLMAEDEQTRQRYLLPSDRAVMIFPQITLSSEESLFLFQGRVLTKQLPDHIQGIVRLYDESAGFIGLGEYTSHQLKGHRLVNLNRRMTA